MKCIHYENITRLDFYGFLYMRHNNLSCKCQMVVPVTWSLYGLYFISTIVIINSRRKEIGSMKLALKKTICDICIVLSPVVLYVGWLIKDLI